MILSVSEFVHWSHTLLDKATNDVIKEVRQAVRANRVKSKMGTINKELSDALRQATLFAMDDASPDELIAPEDLRQQVQNVVENIPLDAFKRDKQLKAIRRDYADSKNQRQLVENLHEFLVDNELYREVPASKTKLEEIHKEDLRLIAFEVFG